MLGLAANLEAPYAEGMFVSYYGNTNQDMNWCIKTTLKTI